MEWKKTLIVTGGVAAIIGAALTVPIVSSNSRSNKTRESRSSGIVSREVSSLKGTDLGIVYVSNVQELQNAIRTASDFETIVVTKKGSPYHISELPCMHTNGYLYVTNSITIRGETGNPYDIIITKEDGYDSLTNRILYIKAQGCKIDGVTFEYGNCTTNEYYKYGGGVYRGGAIYLALATNECLISNCNFNMNGAINGGAIACSKKDDETTIIKTCRFYQNYAIGNGGAIYNGGIIDHCNFIGNSAYKSGGAVCYGNVLWSSGHTYNQAMSNKGSELYGCTAIGYEYAGGDGMSPGSNPMSRFHDCLLDRCRLCVTNGVLFSGNFEVRSSVIVQGTNFTLVASVATNKPSSLVNCTIADNENYRLAGTSKSGLAIRNCIFSRNTSWAEWGMKVNKSLAVNGFFKTIDITHAERYVALGWGGDNPYIEPLAWEESLYSPGGEEIWLDYTNLDSTIKTKRIYDENDDYFIVALSLREYYYVRGWNGDTTLTHFITKPSSVTVKPFSNSRFEKIQTNWTTEETWDAYYRKEGWTGEGDYVHSEFGLYDISESMTNIFFEGSVEGTFFNVSFREMYSPPYWIPESSIWWKNNYWFNQPADPRWTDMKFLGEKNPKNPYAISLESPAYHLNFPHDANQWIIAYTNDWMFSALDLRGVPRLSGGGLDIGAYQAIEYRKPTKFIIRIR